MSPIPGRLLPRVGMADACRRFGLTERALRFYEEKGLIEAGRDRLNHRYYNAAACARLEWIARLRMADVSLSEIRELLDAEDIAAERRELALQMILLRRGALLRRLAILDEVGAGLESHAWPASPPRLRTVG